MATCIIQVVRKGLILTDCKDMSDALSFIDNCRHELLDDHTVIRFITNGNFIHDVWWGDFTRADDYVPNDQLASYQVRF